ncbi:MAG: hypothetical protein GEU95_10580 [Rhizobiales bacterium]|nr:hypothetical protein [Hyphomicrobiales bacterium]
MMIEGAKDFDARFPPKPERTIEESVDFVLANEVAHKAKTAAAARPDVWEFDWGAEADQESIVLAEQRATAIYFNRGNHLIIRQEKGWDDDDDHYICIDKHNARAFAIALCDFLGIEVRKA